MINLYTNSTIGSYTTGTVSCTKNSATVTGTGTTWSEIVNPGDILTLNDDKLYVIKTVNSNTSLTLDKPFAENTVSNSAYRIFLNTAAHFPSDTAAKVERALEQLSDINEAAINNDRTVTAATKIEGKGLTSTAGTINLNPSSVNGNTGGQINFHYNQSENTTSSIVENASGQIRVNGKIELNGNVTSPINVTANNINLRHSIAKGTVPSALDNLALWFGDNTNSTGYSANSLGLFANEISTSNVVSTYIRAMKNEAGSSVQCSISANVDANGNLYTYAPTPASNDSSTKIATTAFVNNRLPYTSGTFTPVFKGDSTAGAFTYSAQEGKYWKIGRLVYIYINLTGKCTSQPIGNYCGITGLPFNAAYSPNCGVSTSDYCGGGTSDCFHRICWAYIAQSNNFGEPTLLPKVIHSTNNTFDYAKITASDTSGYNLSIAVNESFHMRFTGIYLASS